MALRQYYRGLSAQQVVKSTERLASVLLVAAVLISIGSFPGYILGYPADAERVFLVSGVFLILLSLAMMSYAGFVLNMVTRSGVEVSVDRGFEGDILGVSYRLCNESIVPLGFVETLLRYPGHLRLAKGSRRALIVIPPKGCVVYRAWFEGRVGRHAIGPLRVVVRDPLGLFRSDEIDIGGIAELRVFPRIAIEAYRESTALSRAIGIARTRMAGSGTEFLSTREYREGDEPRRIVWRHTSRWGRLIVKETERESSLNIEIVLPIDGESFRGPYRETPFEISARIIATLSRYIAHRGDNIAMLILSRESLEIIEPVKGMGGYRRVIRALSGVYFSPDMGALGVESYRRTLRILGSMISSEDLVLLFIPPSPNIREAISIIDTISRVVAIKRGSLLVVAPMPETRGNGDLGVLTRVKRLSMIRNALEIVGEARRRGVPAIAVTERGVIRIVRTIEALAR